MNVSVHITDQELYDDKVVDVTATADSYTPDSQGFHGHVSIETKADKYPKEITGEFGVSDYEAEFGFEFVID